jgi:hypothetical protein
LNGAICDVVVDGKLNGGIEALEMVCGGGIGRIDGSGKETIGNLR